MTTTTVPTRDEVEEAMRDVVDPELGINVVDLGLVYDVQIDVVEAADGAGDDTADAADAADAAGARASGTVVTLDMTLTSAACPLTDVIEDQAHAALTAGPRPLASDIRINWVWLPPWGPDKITDEGREQLRALGFNV